MKILIQRIIVCVLLVLTCKNTSLFAGEPDWQSQGECATEITAEVENYVERMLIDGTWDEARLYPLVQRGGSQFVKITVHVVRYSDGSLGIPETRIATAINNLNANVASTGIIFFQYGDTIYLDSDVYADLDTTESDALRGIDYVNNSLNIWFVPDFLDGTIPLCGQASFPSESIQGVILKNSCVATATNDSSFTHEIGHYFGLFHTHETFYDTECVDGSNCTTAGDLICDTPADPRLITDPPNDNVDASCNYFGTELDACGTGVLYTPQTQNIMSYSFKLCRDFFTSEQLSVMQFTLDNDRPDHIYYIITVDIDGGADFLNIQDAVDFASEGNEILVMPGIYYGEGDEVVNTLGKSIILRSQSGSALTTIHGSDFRRGILCTQEEATGAPPVVINGFTITHCSSVESGGGVSCNNTNLVILNSVFDTNQAINRSGGGLFCIGESTVELDNCEFISNTALFGGGIGAYAGCDISIRNSEFVSNSAVGQNQGEGGGLSFSGGNGGEGTTSLMLDNCLFDSNVADIGGGVVSSYSDNVVIQNSTIIYNEAFISGGGIECDNVAIPAIANTIVCDNTPDQINGTYTDDGGNTIGTGCGTPSSADIDGDGYVGVEDLLIVIEFWGSDDPHVDLNHDGVVSVEDLMIVVGAWGPVQE